MTCCDEYCCNHGCNQGRNCPARVAKIGQRLPDAEPLPPSPWRAHLRTASRWALMIVCVLGVATLWAVLIAASAAVAPASKQIDCSLSSFHPDFTPAMREACLKRFKT